MFRREIHRKYKISELDFNARGKESNYGIGITTFESYPFELIVVKDCEFSFHDILEVSHLFAENAVNRRLQRSKTIGYIFHFSLVSSPKVERLQ